MWEHHCNSSKNKEIFIYSPMWNEIDLLSNGLLKMHPSSGYHGLVEGVNIIQKKKCGHSMR